MNWEVLYIQDHGQKAYETHLKPGLEDWERFKESVAAQGLEIPSTSSQLHDISSTEDTN